MPNSTSFRDVSKDGIASGEKRETTVDLVETLHAFVGLELPPGQEMEDSTLVGYTRDSTEQSNSLQRSGQGIVGTRNLRSLVVVIITWVGVL